MFNDNLQAAKFDDNSKEQLKKNVIGREMGEEGLIPVAYAFRDVPTAELRNFMLQ